MSVKCHPNTTSRGPSIKKEPQLNFAHRLIAVFKAQVTQEPDSAKIVWMGKTSGTLGEVLGTPPLYLIREPPSLLRSPFRAIDRLPRAHSVPFKFFPSFQLTAAAHTFYQSFNQYDIALFNEVFSHKLCDSRNDPMGNARFWCQRRPQAWSCGIGLVDASKTAGGKTCGHGFYKSRRNLVE